MALGSIPSKLSLQLQRGLWHVWGQMRVVLMVKNPPANAGDIRDVGSILAWEDSLEEEMATHSSILA